MLENRRKMTKVEIEGWLRSFTDLSTQQCHSKVFAIKDDK